MSWVKLDDRANEHHKLVAAGPLACWLWVCGLMYCNRQEKRTGLIPRDAVTMLFPGATHKLAAKLVEVGLWEPSAESFKVHDYHDYQPTTEEVEERRATRTERAKKGAAARWSKVPSDAYKHASSMLPSMPQASTEHAHGNASAMLTRCPDPDPDPDPKIPPTPRPHVTGVIGFEVDAFLDGIEQGTGTRPAQPSYIDRQHITRGLEKCPLTSEATTTQVLEWVRTSAKRWSKGYLDAGKAEFQRGWHPAKWVEWLNAGCPTPQAKPNAQAAKPAPYHREFDFDAEERAAEERARKRDERDARRSAGGPPNPPNPHAAAPGKHDRDSSVLPVANDVTRAEGDDDRVA